jgi:DnaJ domain
MAAPAGDPYATLGVTRDVSDAELRAAYRHLVQLHHPDHNGGSAESARRFEEIQDAYGRIRQLRETPPTARAAPPHSAPPRSPPADADQDARLAQMEREIREARLARERAQRAAREAAADRPDRPERPSDEELGYIKTDDSFSKIFSDARAELADLLSEGREHPLAKRLSDLIDELDPRG